MSQLDYLWAIYKGKVYIVPENNRTHVDWFEEKGWDDLGFDSIPRGRIEVDTRKRELAFDNNGGGLTPNSVHRAFKEKYKRYSYAFTTVRNPSMYSKTAVKSYGRGVTPKRSYKRNIVPGVTELATSLLSGEVMSRAKDWAKGKKTKLARKLNPSWLGDDIDIMRDANQRKVELIRQTGISTKEANSIGKDTLKNEYKIATEYRDIPKGKFSVWVKGWKRYGKNPGEPISPEVEDMAKSWHGRDVGDITEVEELESFESDLVELGDLEELGILELGTISFKKDQPKLCCDASGHNLEVVSGDQTLDLKGEGIEWKGKRLIPLGYLYSIVYVTDKMHLEGSSGYPEPYEHYLAEDFYKKHLAIEDFDDDTDSWFQELQDMGIVDEAVEKQLLPMVVYDKTDQKILIAGGKYTVTELGIRD
jgi:hypothetical protein